MAFATSTSADFSPRIPQCEFAYINKNIVHEFLNLPNFEFQTIDDVINYRSIRANKEFADKILNSNFKDAFKLTPKFEKDIIKEKSEYIYEKLNFKKGNIYAISLIRQKIKDVYIELNIKHPYRVTHLYNVKHTSTRIDGKVVGAYRIIGRKYSKGIETQPNQVIQN